jgi:hypothetical protein
MFYRAFAFAAALAATQASAITIDLQEMDPAKPYLWFVIDTPGLEVWATFEDVRGAGYGIFPDPMTRESTGGEPQGENILYLEEMWETDLVSLSLSGTKRDIRWIWSDGMAWVTLEDFPAREHVVSAPIPAGLPMLLAGLGGLGLLVYRRRRMDAGSESPGRPQDNGGPGARLR